jgi:hypothetical protein
MIRLRVMILPWIDRLHTIVRPTDRPRNARARSARSAPRIVERERGPRFRSVIAPFTGAITLAGATRRFDGYNYFSDHPEVAASWFDDHVR